MASNTPQSPVHSGTASPMAVDVTVSPQLAPPCLFVSWAQVAGWLGLPITHHDNDDLPLTELEKALTCFFPEEKERFLLTNRTLFHRLPKQAMPLEDIAQEVLDAIYKRGQPEWSWSHPPGAYSGPWRTLGATRTRGCSCPVSAHPNCALSSSNAPGAPAATASILP